MEVFSSCANNITDKVLFPIIASDRPMVHVYRKGKKGKESSGIGPKEQRHVCINGERD